VSVRGVKLLMIDVLSTRVDFGKKLACPTLLAGVMNN